jgi:hypothetical protein
MSTLLKLKERYEGSTCGEQILKLITSCFELDGLLSLTGMRAMDDLDTARLAGGKNKILSQKLQIIISILSDLKELTSGDEGLRMDLAEALPTSAELSDVFKWVVETSREMRLQIVSARGRGK